MSELKIIPFGGVAEIGSNMTLFAKGDKAIIVDCGILFPYENFFGIDYLIPDFSILDQYEINDIIFTHGHEDHIGAITHIIRKLPHVNIHATKFCKELINGKLAYAKMSKTVQIFTTDSIIKFEDINIHPIHVNHSIPETTGMLFEEKDRTTLFISDFKIDLDNPYEKSIDIEKIIRLQSGKSQNLLMLDSTNILNPGKTVGEGELIKDIDNQFSSFDNRIYVTLFSSNIHRLLTIFNLAKKHKKKIGVSGRSIHRYIEAASNAGIIDLNEYNILDEDQIDKDDDNIVVIVSGCQGDFRSSLKRLADGNHSKIKLKRGDVVIFSSKVIPGNEKQVYRIYNSIVEAGAHVVTSADSLIHASGHPGQEDLKYLLDLIACTDYIPIHGETYFLKKHIKFIHENYKNIKTHFVLNGNEVICKKNNLKIKFTTIDEPIIIHSRSIPLEKNKISQRRKIADNGLFIVSISKDETRFDHKGLPDALEPHYEKLTTLISKEVKRLCKSNTRAEDIRILTRRNFQKILGYKPITIVMDHD